VLRHSLDRSITRAGAFIASAVLIASSNVLTWLRLCSSGIFVGLDRTTMPRRARTGTVHAFAVVHAAHLEEFHGAVERPPIG